MKRPKDPFLEKTGAVDPRVASLVEQLPYWEIFDDTVFLVDGRGYIGFELEPFPTELVASPGHLLYALKRLIHNAVDDNETLRVVLEVKSMKAREQLRAHASLTKVEGFLRTLSEANQRFYEALAEAGVLSSYRLFLLVPVGKPRLGYRVPSPAVALLSEFLPFLKGKTHISFNEEEYAAFAKEAKRRQQLVGGLLGLTGLEARPMSGDDLFRLIFRYLNPGMEEPRAPYQPSFDYVPLEKTRRLPEEHPGKTLRSQLVRSLVDNRYWDALRVGRTWLHFWRMADVPNETAFGMLAPLVQAADKPAWVILDYTKVPQEQGEARLRYKFRDQYIAAEQTDVPDVGAEEGAREAAEYLRHIRRSGDSLFLVNALFVLQDEDENNLRYRSDNFYAQASSIEGNPFIQLQRGTFRTWLEAAPCSGWRIGAPRMYPETQAAHFFTWQGPWRHEAQRPKELYFTRWLTSVTLDPFDDSYPNFNALVIGTSGGGKSFLVQHRLTELLRDGETLAVAVDRHRHSYEGLFTALAEEGAAQMIEFGPGSDTVINPFDLPPGLEAPTEEKILGIFSLVRAMVPPNPKRADPAIENRILRSAIEQTYERAAHEEKDPETGEWRKVYKGATISNLIDTLFNLSRVGTQAVGPVEREIATSLGHALGEWSRETGLGKLFDGPSTFQIDPKARFVYMVVREVEGIPHFFPVAMLATVQAVWGFLQASAYPKKVVVIEEAWSLFRHEASLQFVQDLFRRGRTLGIGTWAVSQSVEDFAKENAAAVLNNVSQFFVTGIANEEDLPLFRAVLQNAPDSLLQEALHLVRERGKFAEYLVWLKKGEGGTGGVVRLEVAPESYWTFTTHPADKARRERYVKRLGSFQQAVLSLARES